MQAPLFTVIIPTFKRREKLLACLSSLAAQTLPLSRFEVIVVNDDANADLALDAHCHCPGVSLRVISQNHRGPAAARNRGAAAATGGYLAFTDDDCRPTPIWLETLLEYLTRSDETVAVGGRVINTRVDDIFASASQSLIDYLYEYYNSNPQQARLLTSNNFCIPKATFSSLGGFDETFAGAGGEDRELCLRLCHKGHRLVYAPDALVHHDHDMTLKTFVHQHLTYGYGGGILRRCALTHEFGPIALEPADFYLALLAYPHKAKEMTHPWLGTALFCLSQIATGVGYFHARLKQFVASS
jgi:GT2 family glycosyltransferase